MEKFYIEATRATPELHFDPERHYISIKGESYPEYAYNFYEPAFAWLEEYVKQSTAAVTVDFSLSYLNTSSTKSIMNILDIFEEAHRAGKKITLNWYYDEDNELAYEVGEDFQSYLNIPINLLKFQ